VASCLKQLGGRVRKAHLAIDGAVIRQLQLPLSFVPEDAELATLVQTEAERYAVFSDTEVAFDFQVLRQEEESIALLFAAFRAELLTAVTAEFHAEGVEIESIEPLPFAMVRGLKTQHEALFSESGDLGLLALLPYKLHAATWQDGKLMSWRSIYLDTEGVRHGDAEALGDARRELQRTLLDAPARQWLLVDLPPALEAALPLGGASIRRHSLRQAGEAGELARGAAAYDVGAFPVALNLAPKEPLRKRSFSDRQLAVGGGFAGVLVLALLASTVIDMQVKRLHQAINTVETENAALQAELKRPDLLLASQQAALAGLMRSKQGAAVFDNIRDAVPQDIWLSETAIVPERYVKLMGYSISRTSPLVFAKALGEVPGLANVGMPELKQDKYEGTAVYRFEIQADLAGTVGGPRE
jgi:Tfp pilus assembly protein PilN